jgi:hypothetical protein
VTFPVNGNIIHDHIAHGLWPAPESNRAPLGRDCRRSLSVINRESRSGIAPDRLTPRDPRLDERQKVLRTIVSRAVGGEARLFKDSWLLELGSVCGLGEAGLESLVRSRDYEGYPVHTQALRTAIARTLRARPAGAGREPGCVSRTRHSACRELLPTPGTGQLVIGNLFRSSPGARGSGILGR